MQIIIIMKCPLAYECTEKPQETFFFFCFAILFYSDVLTFQHFFIQTNAIINFPYS